jgi:hypothetical protein
VLGDGEGCGEGAGDLPGGVEGVGCLVAERLRRGLLVLKTAGVGCWMAEAWVEI